jgi:hypothetical protein
MVHGHGYVELEVGVHAQDHLDLGVRPLVADHRVTSSAPFALASSFHPRNRRERTNVL